MLYFPGDKLRISEVPAAAKFASLVKEAAPH